MHRDFDAGIEHEEEVFELSILDCACCNTIPSNTRERSRKRRSCRNAGSICVNVSSTASRTCRCAFSFGDMARAPGPFETGEKDMPLVKAKLAIVLTFFLAAALLGNDLIKSQTSSFAKSVDFVAGLIRMHDSLCYDAKDTMVT